MTDQHPTAPRGLPPATGWGRRLAAAAASLMLLAGTAIAQNKPEPAAVKSHLELGTVNATSNIAGATADYEFTFRHGGGNPNAIDPNIRITFPAGYGLVGASWDEAGSGLGLTTPPNAGTWTAPTLDTIDSGARFLNLAITDGFQSLNGQTTYRVAITGVVNAPTGGNQSIQIQILQSDGVTVSTNGSVNFTLAGPPNAPNAPTGSAGVGQATVSWTAPSDGGSPITGYTVEVSSNGGGDWLPAPGGCAAATTEASTATSCVASPLTPGAGYVFRVRAINAIGPGNFSAPSGTTVILATTPDAPTGASAIAGNQSASVSWTAPSNNGGAAITSYTVTGSPSGTCTATAPSTTCVVSGLSNDLSYTFTVVATNSAGDSPASTASAPVSPQRTASATTITGTTASLNGGTRARTNESFTVNFTVSSADATGISEGGTVTVEAQTAGGAVVGSCSGAATAGAGSCVLSGLKPSDNVARLVASLAQTPRLLASQSSPFAFDVARSNTTSTLTSNSPSVFGQDIVLNASFNATAPGANPVTGTARFVRQPGNITITEVAITPGIGGAASTASTTITTKPDVSLSPITYNVVILDNTDFIGSNNSTVHTVNRASTTLTINSITPTAGPDIEVNETVTVSATVAAVAPGEGTPNGTVQVRGTGGDAAATTGCDISLSGGTGTCQLSFSTKGDATLVFSYVQSANFAASSNSQAVTVLGLPVTLTLTPPGAAPFFGNSYDVGYSLTGGAGNFDGAVSLSATGPSNATATCVSNSAPTNNTGVCTFVGGQNVGAYTLDGAYAGDTQDLPAIDGDSLSIVQATTELTVTTTPSSSAAGEGVLFAVELSLTNGTGALDGSIEVTANGLTNAGVTSSGCTITVTAQTSPFTADCTRAFTLFGDDQVVSAVFVPSSTNFAGDSATTLHDVTSASTQTLITGFTPTSPQVGDAVTVGFDVNGGEGTYEGVINVSVNGSPVTCSPALSFDTITGVGSCRVRGLFQTAGDYSFVVAFDGTELGNDADSTSDASVLTVDPRSTSLSLSAAPASQQQAGQSVVFTVNAAAITGPSLDGFDAGNVASGTAYVCLASSPVCDSSSALCTATLSGAGTDGAAAGTCPSSFAAVGNYSFVANYVGNTNFAGSTSAALPYAVEPRDTSISITRVSSFTSGSSPAASALVGERVTVVFDVDGGLGEYEGSVTVTADGPGPLSATCDNGSFNIETGVGSCTFSVGSLNGLEQVGTWSFSADFIPGVEGNDAASTTGLNAASINILQASTTLVLSSSPAPSVFGQPFTLTATVTATPPSEGYPTGDVNFFDGESNAIGVVTLAPTGTPGVSSASIPNLTRNVAPAPGWRFVAATITNPNFAGANDFGYDHLVNRDNQTVSVSAPSSVPFAPAGSFNVSAVATANFTSLPSGQAVNLSAGPAGVCSGSGSSSGGSDVSISILGGGTCVISASVPQSNNYNAVAPQTVDVTIAPIDQTISFAALPNRSAGAGTFELSATAPGGTVSFASTTGSTCSVSGTTVSYVGAGECSITASQGGNASYNAAPDVVRSFYYVAVTVNPETLNGGTRNQPYSAQFTATAEGATLPFTFAVTAGALPDNLNLAANGELSGTPSSAGSFNFTITATDSSTAPNLDTPYSGSRAYTLVIARNPQVITFGAAPSLVYDGPNGTLSATGGASGNPVVFSSLTPTICSVSADQVTPLLAGTCTVAADQAGNSDYEDAPQVTQEIEVAKAAQAPLTVVAATNPVAYLQTSALSVTGGNTGGDVTYTVTAGESVCSVSGSTLTATAGSSSCTVTATMAGDDNYMPGTGTLTVNTVQAGQDGFALAASANPIQFNGTSTLSVSGALSSGALSYAITGDTPAPGAGPSVCSLAGNTVAAIGVGSCEITAIQAADANYEEATDSVLIIVDKAEQSINFGANPGPLTIGGSSGSVVATATSGLSVEYGVDGGSAGVCTVDATSGAITMVTAGSCVLTASQAGNAFYEAAPQVTQAVVINQEQPSISLVGSGSPTSPGNAVTFTATVSGGFNPTGTVTFQNNGASITGCVNVALTGLSAECVTSALPQGSHPITATYNGDINNQTATSNTVTQIVLTGTTIVLSPSNITEARFGQPVSVGYAVSGGVAPNEGMVTVTASRPGSIVTCTAAASAGACTLTGLVTTGPVLADGYTVSAAYDGDGNDGASSTTVSQTLNVLRSNTNTALTIAPPTSSPFGQGFTLTATVTAVAPGTGVPPGSIVFLRDGQSIGEVPLNGAGVATLSVPAGLAVGSYVFRAEYAQTTNYLQSFANANYAVTAKATTTTITGSSVNPSALGASVGFTYTVSTSPADTTPTGTVTLTASTGESCSASVAAGTCSLSFTTAGARTVTAVYGGDPVHATSTSAAFAHSVNKGTQAALTATATPSTILFGGSSTLATTGGTGSGAVSFAVTAGGSFCAVSGNTLTGTGVGTCTVTATKAGDDNYEPTSATVDVTVNRAPQAALSVTATPSTIVFQGTSALAADGGSGAGAVSFAVTGGTGSCSIAGNTLTGTGVGTCVVTATRSGGDNYLDQTGTVTVTVNQAPQTIIFGANPGPLTFGGSSGSVTATASSGLPVSYSTTSTGVCSVDSGTGAITIIGAGNCVVAANQAGNANWLPAPEATQTVVINKAQQAALTATATPTSIAFQGTSALAATGGTGDGAISFAVTGGTGTCTISGSTLTGTAVGTCVVTATKAGDANYEPQTGTVTVTVGQASQTITFGPNPGPLTFGGTSGTVSATASSGLAVSFGSSTPAVCSVNASSGAITMITAGNCVVTANQAGNANFAAAPEATQTVVINFGTQQPLVVTATPNPVVAGQTSALSTTGGSGTGAVSYAVTAGGASCTVSGSTLTAVAQGSCTVTATKAGDSGYLPQTGTVVVTVNPATVDLSIEKTGRYIPNGVLWTLNVGNAGPGSATGATVIDTLPNTVTGATWTCTGTNGGSCSVASGSGNINTSVNVPVGGSVVFQITATLVNPNATSVVNTASVVAPMGITDINEANNTSTLDLQVALFADGFEGSGNGFGSFEPKASLSTLQIDGASVEQALRGIEPQDVGVYAIGDAQLRVQAREINGLVEVRLIQREGKGLWSSTRWIELWPGDSVRLDYSKAGNALQTRLAVGM